MKSRIFIFLVVFLTMISGIIQGQTAMNSSSNWITDGENAIISTSDGNDVDVIYDNESKTYTIKTATGLAWVAYVTNNDLTKDDNCPNFPEKKGFEGYIIKLNNDIVLNEGELNANSKQWTPIGKLNNRFAGSFDGANYVVRGLYINVDEDSNVSYVGLIGYAERYNTQSGADIIIKNIGIENSYIKVEAEECFVGSVVGLANTSVSCCYNTGAIEVSSTKKCCVGGIVGGVTSAMVSISYCYNTGFIQATSTNSGQADPSTVGGVAGGSSMQNSNCYNTGSIIGNGKNCFAGGIFGGGMYNISDCYNFGSVTTTNGEGIVGSMVGYYQSGAAGSLESCVVYEEIDAKKNIGAILQYSNTTTEFITEGETWEQFEQKIQTMDANAIVSAMNIAETWNKNAYIEKDYLYLPAIDDEPQPKIKIPYQENPEQPGDDNEEDQDNDKPGTIVKPIKYYNIYVDTICPGLNVEVSKDVVQEGHQVSAYLTIQAECDTTGMRFEYKRGLFGYWKDLKELEGVQPGEYIIKNIYTDIYIRALDATLPEEEPTGIEAIEGAKAYAKDGSIYVYTPSREEVMIIGMTGTIIKNEEQVGLQSYSVSRGIYIVRIGDKVFKLKN